MNDRAVCKCLLCSGHFWLEEGSICLVRVDDQEVEAFVCETCLDVWHDRIVAKIVSKPEGGPDDESG